MSPCRVTHLTIEFDVLLCYLECSCLAHLTDTHMQILQSNSQQDTWEPIFGCPYFVPARAQPACNLQSHVHSLAMSFCTLHLVSVAARAVSAFTHILSVSVVRTAVQQRLQPTCRGRFRPL